MTSKIDFPHMTVAETERMFGFESPGGLEKSLRFESFSGSRLFEVLTQYERQLDPLPHKNKIIAAGEIAKNTENRDYNIYNSGYSPASVDFILGFWSESYLPVIASVQPMHGPIGVVFSRGVDMTVDEVGTIDVQVRPTSFGYPDGVSDYEAGRRVGKTWENYVLSMFCLRETEPMVLGNIHHDKLDLLLSEAKYSVNGIRFIYCGNAVLGALIERGVIAKTDNSTEGPFVGRTKNGIPVFYTRTLTPDTLIICRNGRDELETAVIFAPYQYNFYEPSNMPPGIAIGGSVRSVTRYPRLDLVEVGRVV